MTRTATDISDSLSNAKWVMVDADQDKVEIMMRRYDLPEFIARLLVSREISIDDVETFLKPSLAKNFPDPFSLKDMDKASEELAKAISQGKGIGIFADFDVDGATSTGILVRFFKEIGLDVPFYIPDRLEEGYGPNVNALQKLKEQGAEYVLICDCGTTSFEVIEQGKALGLKIFILDHHESEDKLPIADYIINPKRKDDDSNLDMLAACGVAFMLCVAVNNKLRSLSFYKEKGLKEPSLKDLMDLLALGTICDMVPLKGPNRLFVKTGFKQMGKLENEGIKALAYVSGVNEPLNVYHAGFVLGPRINAGSRIHKADLGAKILSTYDYEEAKNIAFTLNDCNAKRKDIEQDMYRQATELIEEKELYNHSLIIVGDEAWHPGLSGLVAGRIKEKYGKPTCVITFAKDDLGNLEGRGSGRSIKGINMGAIFIDAKNEGLLIKGGGHAMAAGFTIAPDKIEQFSHFVFEHANKQLEGQSAVSETQIDGLLSVNGAKLDFIKQIHEQVGPFGQENPEPLFLLSNVRLHMVDIVGKDHIKMMISDWEGGTRIKAIAFRAKDTALGEAFLKHGNNEPFHIIGHFKVNVWNDRESVELQIRDGVLAINNNLKKIA
jgi:single-stranded-DNA-specific exonuclease